MSSSACGDFDQYEFVRSLCVCDNLGRVLSVSTATFFVIRCKMLLSMLGLDLRRICCRFALPCTVTVTRWRNRDNGGYVDGGGLAGVYIILLLLVFDERCICRFFALPLL